MSDKNSLASAYVALNRQHRELQDKLAKLQVENGYLSIQHRLAEDEVKLLKAELDELRKAARHD